MTTFKRLLDSNVVFQTTRCAGIVAQRALVAGLSDNRQAS